MCVILDNNVVFEVFADGRPPAGEGFFNWIDSGRGRLVGGGKLLKELGRNENFLLWWRQAVLAGRATRVDDDAVQAETNRLADGTTCRSNDPHVIALAVVGGARLLYTNDRKLQHDFKNRHLIDDPTGKVYSTRRNGSFNRRKRELLAGSSCRLHAQGPRR